MSYELFIPLAALVIASALGVVLNRHPVRSALCLVATLFLLAVLFVCLDAHLVAALQVVVYAGAIMVLFLFVIMLLNLQQQPSEPGRMVLRLMGSAVGGAFVLVTIAGLRSARSVLPAGVPEGFGTTAAVSERLFTHFLLPFELTSLLLLIAIVGAVVVAKRTLD